MRFTRRAVGADILTAALLTVTFAACSGQHESAFTSHPANRMSAREIVLPWRQAGLTEREAAIHLLNRFTFGIRPGDVENVLERGPEQWLAAQLNATPSGDALRDRLARYDALDMTDEQIASAFPLPGRIQAEARREGVLLADGPGARPDSTGLLREREELQAYARAKGYRPEKELMEQLVGQKVLRAVYGEDQLAEVLADFWFNHFNVSITNNQAKPYVLTFERDAIRPFVLGRFRDMLEATARHPAMLQYLDNAKSVAVEGAPTTLDAALARQRAPRRQNRPVVDAPKKRPTGVNENYARELMELHTLGVDGGYTQKDVQEVARAFTGWTVMPAGPGSGEAVQNVRTIARRLGPSLVVEDGSFLFRPGQHDAAPKLILGRQFPAGRGIEDGEEVLDMLASSPATARHLARQLCIRFVSDTPSDTLVGRVAEVFESTHGDLQRVTLAIASSNEFWAQARRPEKIKSPLELAVSAVRAAGASVDDPLPLARWIARMGEPLYAYQAPSGYPDRADAWINTGSLMSRMNFGLALASGRIPGVQGSFTQDTGVMIGSPAFQHR
ncbi:MAG TPA: DUF1800 domain-containing protein [Bacteroidota bacterium]